MGKSACATILRHRGAAVLDADELAHALTKPGQPALIQIQDAFGNGMLDASGALRRSVLADLVFSDPVALKKLESILHPKITAAWRRQLSEWVADGRSFAVVVIPLLFETACEGEFQTTVCVACSAGTQAERLRLRGWAQSETDRRLSAQLPIEQKMAAELWR